MIANDGTFYKYGCVVLLLVLFGMLMKLQYDEWFYSAPDEYEPEPAVEAPPEPTSYSEDTGDASASDSFSASLAWWDMLYRVVSTLDALGSFFGHMKR